MAPPIARLETLETLASRIATLETALLQEQRRGLWLARLVTAHHQVLQQALEHLRDSALTNDMAHTYERLTYKLTTMAQVQRLLGIPLEKEGECDGPL